jgi:N-acetylneuraminic acid mutarotase
MKPFVLEEALAGAKVMTGDKKLVTDIAYFPSVDGSHKVCAVILGQIITFTVTGRISNESPHPLMDLFMAPVKKEGWINIYKDEVAGRSIYKTEEEARASCNRWPGLIACISIEWEE